jgi:5S rRNA maturation endonuclease (ribonuclease M5)
VTGAYNTITLALETQTGYRPPREGGDYRCPNTGGHSKGDRSPSLSVTPAPGQVLMHCHAGCSPDDVLGSIGLTTRDLFDEPGANGKGAGKLGKPVAVYTYQSAEGETLFEVVRFSPKTFRQRVPDPLAPGGYRWSTHGIKKPLFNLMEVRAAVIAGRSVWIVEGEKDVEALRAAGEVATCNAGGAGKWNPDHALELIGANVIVVPDQDEAGRNHARDIVSSLRGLAVSIDVRQPVQGKDAADHLAAGYKVDEFKPTSLDEVGEIDEAPVTHAWPVMRQEGYFGVVGDVVNTIGPHSEADPVALALHLLVMYGNAVGPSPYFLADGAKHHARLYAVIVGKTSRARKGTAEANVRRVMAYADPDWTANCRVSGLTSGEGLISDVADPALDDDGNLVSGSRDRRRNVTEAEFARVLSATKREGNTLSSVIRQAWDDDGALRVMTRKDPLRASSSHISMIGHITEEELAHRLADVEVMNGFGNRFLWARSQRSKLLPSGGSLDEKEFDRLGRIIRNRMAQARKVTRVTRSPAAEELWAEMYHELANDEVGGMVGAVTARAEANLLRLSLVYTLTDDTNPSVIEPKHLIAARAMWDYVAQSAEQLFGGLSGNDDADKLFAAVEAAGSKGLTGTEQQKLFGRHKDSNQLQHLRDSLKRQGKVVTTAVPTSGRSAIRTVSTRYASEAE